jgi:hypothetical protein
MVMLLCGTAFAGEVRPAELPTDPSFWQHLDTLPPTPKGAGYLPGVESGKFVQFRYAVPDPKPARYLLNLDNIVAMRGGGTAYQVEVHLDSARGPLLYKGPKITVDHDFNAEDLSRLDATELLTDAHAKQGYLDVWATAWVEGDTWTTYNDDAGTRWDLYALVPDPEAFARWEKLQRERAEMLNRGICVIPQPQQMTLRPQDFRVSKQTTVSLSGTATEDDKATAETLRKELGRWSGSSVSLASKQTGNQVRLVLAADRGALEKAVGFEVPQDLGEQGYALDVKGLGVVAAAHTTVGLYYAAQTLMQLVVRDGKATVIRGVRIVDWPDLRYRMMQYDIARGNTVNVEYWKRWIRELSRLKVNQLMLYMEDDWHSPKYPFLGRPDTFTPEKARELVAYAKQYHVELVPQLESLGHADALLGHDELKDLRLGGGAWAICPNAERALPVLDDLYGELSEAFPQSPLLHVGGDEVWGFAADPRCADMVKQVGEEGVYAFHLNNLQKLLAKRGRKLAFWGDEVLAYPKVADALTRDAVVFDWHYGNQQAYPSIKFFQDRGFKELYVYPAVHGFFDVYPQYRMAFGNISGFTRAGAEQGVQGVCCTTWGMNRGGNAENYLYGLAYAAECAWSSKETDREFFDQRFPTVWLGVPAAGDNAAEVDRAFWFAWRGEEQAPFWQHLFEVSRLFFGPYDGFADKLGDEDRSRLASEAQALGGLCRQALESLGRLRKATTRNAATLDALEHAVRVHDHVARKSLALCALADAYRAAYAQQPRDARKLRGILEEALGALRKLAADLPVLEAGLKDGIDHRGGDPNDLTLFEEACKARQAYAEKLDNARAAIDKGAPPPDPAALGLGHRLLVKIGQWATEDINPSDAQHPKRLVFDVTQQLKAADKYEVEWDYTRGQDGLDIVSTGLYQSSSAAKQPDDLAPVVVDEHHAFTGAADRDNRYRLTVEHLRPNARYFVVGLVYNQREFDTFGDVWLRQGWGE